MLHWRASPLRERALTLAGLLHRFSPLFHGADRAPAHNKR